jgi:uncharacterized membrane protein YcaP (DUF421 family)
MFDLSLPWWELAARAALVYLGVLLLLRLLGKRQFGELGPFDVILLLLVSEAAANALVGGDLSLPGAAILVVVMLLLDWGIGKLAVRSARVERALEGRPRFLVKRGRVDYAVLRAEGITHNELLAALRSGGCFSPKQADYAVLETTGSISVRARRDAPQREDARSGAGGGSSAEGSSKGASARRAGAPAGGERSGRPVASSASRRRSA